jgi:hypothetical protein
LHSPTIERPPRVSILANETKTVQLSTISDLDASDTPVFKSVTIDKAMAFEILNFNNASREIVIDPKSDEKFVGNYIVWIELDDLAKRTSKYRMEVVIKPMNPFVPKFQIFKEKEEVKIKTDSTTNITAI